jgi:Hsp70 protein
MAGSLGISIGTANLVATSASGSPTVRRSVLTLFGHRPPEVGTPAENPRLNERGLVLTGFVERVGDPVPLVAADGSSFRGERLMADALEALSREAGTGGPPEFLCATVPANWRRSAVESLRSSLRDQRGLSRNGEPLPLISEVVAALTALQARPGLPARGVIALCDFGAAGTSITLADAGNGYRSVAPTVRYEDFSGDLIDQAILRQMLTDLEVDPSSTSAVVSLSQVRDQCRRAKERLSYETATGLTGPQPGAQSTVRLTRSELETLVQEPLDGVIGAIQETLQRNNIGRNHLVAIATVGGGARIPFVTQRLSEALGIPVTTSPQAQVVAAVGAALIASRGPEEETVTGLTPAPGVLAAAVAAAAGERATQTVQSSAEVMPLAWSEDSTEDVAPTEYSGHDSSGHDPDHDADPTDQARPKVSFGREPDGALPPVPVYRRPGVLFGAAALVALLAAAGLILTLRSGGVSTVPAGTSNDPPPSVAAIVPEAPPSPVAPAPPPPAQHAPIDRQQAPSIPRRQQAPAPVYAPTQVAEPAAPPPEPIAEEPIAEAPISEAPAPEAPALEAPQLPIFDPSTLIPTIPGFDPGALIPGGGAGDTGGTAAGGDAVQPPTDP